MPKERLIFIDSLRGVAALIVLLYHYYNAILPSSEYRPFGEAIHQVLQLGHLGVFIFFVLSGFVIARSLGFDEISFSLFGNFLVRRFIRLGIPYWTVIVLTGLSIVVMSRYGLTSILPYKLTDYLINFAYADNLANTRSIVNVGWTLEYEIQFYLVYALVLLLVSKMAAPARVLYYCLIASFLLSLLYWFAWFPFYRKTLFLDYWFHFLLGVFAYEYLTDRIHQWQYTTAVALASVHMIMFPDPATLTAIVTSLLLVGAGRLGAVDRWLTWKPLAFLGTISYSLYLLHPFFGNRVLRLAVRNFDFSPFFAVVMILITLLLTILLSWMFYTMVERPAIRLSTNFRK